MFQIGTSHLPESPASEPSGSDGELLDVPRVGPLMWLMLLALVLPPAFLVLLQRLGPVPVATRPWVVLLCLPFFLVLLSLPRRYRLNGRQLVIEGLFYRKRIPREQIVSARRIGSAAALVSLGSVFCSDPGRAIELQRRRGRALVISPRRPELFLAALPAGDRDQGV